MVFDNKAYLSLSRNMRGYQSSPPRNYFTLLSSSVDNVAGIYLSDCTRLVFYLSPFFHIVTERKDWLIEELKIFLKFEIPAQLNPCLCYCDMFSLSQIFRTYYIYLEFIQYFSVIKL